MAEDNRSTTAEVIDAVNQYFGDNDVEAEESALVGEDGGVRLTAAGSEVGRVFGFLRREVNVESEQRRDPSSENVTFNLKTSDGVTAKGETDDSQSDLGELFG